MQSAFSGFLISLIPFIMMIYCLSYPWGLLQELLLADKSEVSFVLLPDITAATMAHILDYIYTGSVILPSSSMTEFLSVAGLLKLRIEDRNPEPKLPPEHNGCTNYYNYPPGYDLSRYKHPYDYKNPLCGPECYKTYPYKNGEDPSPCDYKLQEKVLKFSPIIIQDERNPGLTNGGTPPENKVGLNYYKSKDLSPAPPMYLEHPRDLQNDQPNLVPYKPTYLTSPPNGYPENLPGPPMKVPEAGYIPNGVPPESLKEINGIKKKPTRKIPNLMPISRFTAFKTKRGLYNRVFPSPWTQRISPLVVDPRNEYVTREKTIVSTNKLLFMTLSPSINNV